jgi:hypothetical protein
MVTTLHMAFLTARKVSLYTPAVLPVGRKMVLPTCQNLQGEQKKSGCRFRCNSVI